MREASWISVWLHCTSIAEVLGSLSSSGLNFCSWMLTSMSVVACPIALTYSLTHSILINLFIKLELNNFLLPPLLSIVFVQECSVVFGKDSDEGRLERRTFLPEKWRAWVRVCRALIMAAIVVSPVYSFSFVNMTFSDYQLLLTRRWKLVEVVMTVVIYQSQQQSFKVGQRV